MRLVAGLALALAVSALVACGGSSEDAAAPMPATPLPAGADREPAPAITGDSLDGEALTLDDFRGRPVLVNVWSSW